MNLDFFQNEVYHISKELGRDLDNKSKSEIYEIFRDIINHAEKHSEKYNLIKEESGLRQVQDISSLPDDSIDRRLEIDKIMKKGFKSNGEFSLLAELMICVLNYCTKSGIEMPEILLIKSQSNRRVKWKKK